MDGVFRAYLHRRGLSLSRLFVFRCRLFPWKRKFLERRLGAALSPERIVKVLCSDGTKWRVLAAYVCDVFEMKKKAAVPPT